MTHQGRAVGLERFRVALCLIARLDSYRLLERAGLLTRGDIDSLVFIQDEYAMLSGVGVRSRHGGYGAMSLDRTRRVSGA